MKLILVLLVVCGCGFSNPIPSYIERCSQKDPNLEQCILRSAQKAVPRLMQGDADLNIIDVNNTPTQDQTLNVDGISYSLKNIKHEAGELVPIFVRVDIDKSYAIIGMSLPFLVWKGDFEATGDRNGKHIDASGKFTIKYDGLQFNYTRHFTDKVVDGKKYLQIQLDKDHTDGHLDHISIKHEFDAKAHGKSELESMIPDLRSALQVRLQFLCSSLVSYVMNSVLASIPKNDMFLE